MANKKLEKIQNVAVNQTIKLSIINVTESVVASVKPEFTFSIRDKAFALPKINIGRSSEIETLSASEIKRIKAISFDAYQVDLKLYERDWEQKLKKTIDIFWGINLDIFLKLRNFHIIFFLEKFRFF